MKYAWIVDKDPATDPSEELYRVGLIDADAGADDLVAKLKNGEGVRWRTKYEPGEDPEHNDIVHEGRIVFEDGSHEPDSEYTIPEEGFEPYDFSRRDCGAVFIEYLVGGKWVQL